MKFNQTEIKGVWIIENISHEDSRGVFSEWFKQSSIKAATKVDFTPVQANYSISNKNVIRGIHFSKANLPQSKLIYCLRGMVDDVIVDIRPNSSTFRKWIKVPLSPDNGLSVLIEPNLGHGFLSRENNSCISYLLSQEYNPEMEIGINPFDDLFAIDWGIKNSEAIMSQKDKTAPSWNNIKL